MNIPGDAWRYCDNLDSPEAVRELVQAALLAHLTLAAADPDRMDTDCDWPAVQADLHAALAAVGHPAGQG